MKQKNKKKTSENKKKEVETGKYTNNDIYKTI